MQWKKEGRMFKHDNKECFYIARVEKHGSVFDFSPCECDAMGHFILEALNNGNFEQYYKKYMEK